MKRALFRSTCRHFLATLPGDASASCGLIGADATPHNRRSFAGFFSELFVRAVRE
jgi:hypothetical protein